MTEPSHLMTATIKGQVRFTPEDLASLPSDYECIEDLLLEKAHQTFEGVKPLYPVSIRHWQVADTAPSVDTSGTDVIFTVEVRYER